MLRILLVLGILGPLAACGSDSDPGTMPDAGTSRGDAATDAGSQGDAGSSDDADATDRCAVAPNARPLIEEIVDKLLRDAAFVAGQSHFFDVGFAHGLPFVDNGYFGSLSRMFICTDETWYIHTCDDWPAGEPRPPFFETRNRCIRLGCEAADVNRIEVYFTELPHDAPDDPHPFSYESEALGGSVTFDPNPSLIWTIAELGDEHRDIATTVSRAPIVTFTAGGTVDLTHQGTASSVIDTGELLEASVSLTFPSAARGNAVTVVLAVGDAHAVSGSITANGTEIGTYSGVFDALDAAITLTWSADCGG